MSADYGWSLIRGTSTGGNKRQKKTKWVFDEILQVRISYKNSVFYLILYIVIRNQYIASVPPT